MNAISRGTSNVILPEGVSGSCAGVPSQLSAQSDHDSGPVDRQPIRRCAYTRCNAVLVRHPGEKPSRFKGRGTCGYSCSVAQRHERNQKHSTEAIETIGRLYGTMKCADIGAMINVSKNVVIGIYHRNFREVHVKKREANAVVFPQRGCLYGFGEPGVSPDFHFCGEPAMEGTAWCERHRAIVYQPEKPKEITP